MSHRRESARAEDGTLRLWVLESDLKFVEVSGKGSCCCSEKGIDL